MFKRIFVHVLTKNEQDFCRNLKQHEELLEIFFIFNLFFIHLKPFLIVVQLQTNIKNKQFDDKFGHSENFFCLRSHSCITFSVMKHHEVYLMR
jgi:hypothetical protein